MENYFKNLFEREYILTELRKETADKYEVHPSDLPFNDIFGNDIRIVIPLAGTETYSELMDELKKVPNYSHFDSEKGEVIRQIPIKGPNGSDIKTQSIPLGSVISKLKVSNEKKKEFLDFYSQYGSALSEIENKNKYSIILSRSPLDIIRMSDVGGITSCHSPGANYYACALAEGKSGGPVAFLIYTEDLAKIAEKEMQEEEIFRDRQREIKGIDPLARIRVRRYTDENDVDYAIPEIRLYGKRDIEGFYTTLKKFLLEKQGEKISDLESIASMFNARDIWRRGGSYSDTQDSELFNKFFDTREFRGSLQMHVDEEGEGQDRYEQMEEELATFRDYGNETLKYTSLDYSLEDDGDNVYYNMWGSLSIDLGETKLTQSIDVNDPDQFQALLKTSSSYISSWNKKFVDENPEIQKFLLLLNKFSETDIDERFSGVRYNEGMNVLNFYIRCGRDGDGFSWDTDDYKTEIDEMRRFEQSQYEDFKMAVVSALVGAKLIQNYEYGGHESLYDQWQSLELEFDYIDYEIKSPFSFDLEIIISNEYYDATDLNAKLQDIMEKKIESIYNLFVRTTLRQNELKRDMEERQMKFTNFMESFDVSKKEFNFEVETFINTTFRNTYFKVSFYPDKVTDLFIQFMQLVDEVYPEIRSTIISAVSQYLKSKKD